MCVCVWIKFYIIRIITFVMFFDRVSLWILYVKKEEYCAITKLIFFPAQNYKGIL